ncbi:MAG: trigger factor [bacterium]
MKYISKQLPKSQVELVITVEPADYKKDLEKAAIRISERAAIKGFRSGKAPYDIVKQEVGAIKIMEEAMQTIVQSNFTQAIKQEKLETIGMPEITIEKIAPENDFVFKAIVALLPKIKLGDINKIKVTKKEANVEDGKVDEILTNLKKMQAKEVITDRKAEEKDKAVIDMEMFINKVPVEGGQAKGHAVYLNEQHYIPGLNEELVGLGKDDTKEFTLKFPKEHYQKHLAGKNVDFQIKVSDIFELQYPELNDEFAKTLGMENMDKLKSTLQTNLQKEQETKEDQRMEIEIFDKLIESSEFGEIPEILVDSEKHKMFHELKSQLSQQGIELEKYLKDLKKTEKEIHDDFAGQADKRVKSALVSRQIAMDNNIKAEKEDIKEEIELIKKTYPNDKTVEENLQKQEVLDTLAVAVQNRKVIKWLKERVMEDKK